MAQAWLRTWLRRTRPARRGVGLRRTRSDGGATVFFSFFLKILFGDASQVSRLGEPWREVGFESGHVRESRVLAGLTSLLVGAWSMAKEKFGEEITLRYAITRNYVTLRYVTFPEPRLRVQSWAGIKKPSH